MCVSCFRLLLSVILKFLLSLSALCDVFFIFIWIHPLTILHFSVQWNRENHIKFESLKRYVHLRSLLFSCCVVQVPCDLFLWLRHLTFSKLGGSCVFYSKLYWEFDVIGVSLWRLCLKIWGSLLKMIKMNESVNMVTNRKC